MYEHPRNRSFGHSRARHPGAPWPASPTANSPVRCLRRAAWALSPVAARHSRGSKNRCALPAKSLATLPLGANVMLMDPQAPQVAELLTAARRRGYTGAGSPANFMAAWKEAGIKVVPVVASSALAAAHGAHGRRRGGCRGLRAGGHIGELTTMALVPSVCDAVRIPVIAAGGIADGRGMAAAFALGAEGVQVGTAPYG